MKLSDIVEKFFAHRAVSDTFSRFAVAKLTMRHVTDIDEALADLAQAQIDLWNRITRVEEDLAKRAQPDWNRLENHEGRIRKVTEALERFSQFKQRWERLDQLEDRLEGLLDHLGLAANGAGVVQPLPGRIHVSRVPNHNARSNFGTHGLPGPGTPVEVTDHTGTDGEAHPDGGVPVEVEEPGTDIGSYQDGYKKAAEQFVFRINELREELVQVIMSISR